MLSKSHTAACISRLQEITAHSANEEQFKIGAESILEEACKELDVFWNPYTYERSFSKGSRRVDAIHGSTIIEYEPPRSFNRSENAQLRHGREQAEEYAHFLSEEEGREVGKYSLVAWDGETISFGHFNEGSFEWDPARQFDAFCLSRLLTQIADGGRPLVSPLLLRNFIGPQTEIGKTLLPALFRAICKSQETRETTRTKLIYTEWSRLFGQISGTATERLIAYMEDISRLHKTDYHKNPQAYVFALNTYIAIISKICAVYALASQSEAVIFDADPLKALAKIESGEYFKMFGIENMLNSDFFSWYLGEDIETDLSAPLGLLLERMRAIDFNMSLKNPQSIRDLFKGLYMEFTPAPMRHALGEYYTPDWLASHILNVASWKTEQTLLDPTCGSGTFILEGLKRKLLQQAPSTKAHDLLDGLYGFDLNPLAVLTAKASIVVFLSGKFDPAEPLVLPIYLADAINTTEPKDDIFTHTLLTEKGPQTFAIPVELAESPDFFSVMNHLKACIDADLNAEGIMRSLSALSPLINSFDQDRTRILASTVCDLIALHENHWNGIWCLILFDRIKAACVRDIDLVAGNPPWVRWSNLPKPYAEFVKPICDRMDIFSEDSWVGGIQSDVSTVIAYHALERFVKRGGALAFLITATVFKNESSQGFRRWKLHDQQDEPMTVEVVEDYGALKPFDGVSNWPALLFIKRNGKATRYPVKYRRYQSRSEYQDLKAIPVPGSADGPWLVGTESELLIWPKIFDADKKSPYQARKGVTTDLNGLYFVKTRPASSAEWIQISNDPHNGRQNIPAKTSLVEKENIFPLIRGRDVRRFRATPEPGQGVIVPQRGMFGDPDLPSKSPRLFQFLSGFKSYLEKRSSYRRFQKGKPFWSIWSTGEYTFAPFKVLWKEMSGSRFVAAYTGSLQFCGENKVVVPDHKVYFVPLETEDEAAYLAAFLNAPVISAAISAYASALSLGTSVTDYLRIPRYDASNRAMKKLADMAKAFGQGTDPTEDDEHKLDQLVIFLLER